MDAFELALCLPYSPDESQGLSGVAEEMRKCIIIIYQDVRVMVEIECSLVQCMHMYICMYTMYVGK